MHNDLNRDPEYRHPVVIQDDGMGAGAVAVIAIFAFLAIGGVIYFFNTSDTRVAINPPASSPTVIVPAPAPTTPAPGASTTGSAPAR